MTIRRLLKASSLAGLQEVEQRLNRAYRDVLRSLHLVDRNDPIAEIVAKTVIEIGATGVREPSEISKIAVKRLAQLGRPPKVADLYDIAPWVCQALDNPKRDRVGHQSNDGDGSRSGLEVQHHAGRNRDDQIRRVTLDHDILSFDITKAAQFLEK